MDHWMIIAFVVLAGLALALFLPQSSYECVLYSDVVCIDYARGLSDDDAAHRAVYQFVGAEFAASVPSLAAFKSEDRSEYALSVEGTTYTFTNHAASPQWSVTVEKLSLDKWRVVRHSRFVTERD